MVDEMKLTPMMRLADIETVPDAQSDTVQLTFSSEEPYDRGWGIEILGHRTGEVDLSWMASGRAPLLVDHDSGVDSCVGTVERAWIENGRGKATVRFGKTERAQSMLKRVRDGDLGNVSVGYRISEMVLVAASDGKETYRVTAWKPLEASLVTIPADPTVGVGRADLWNEQPVKIRKDTSMTTANVTKTAEPVPLPPVNADDILKAERARIADITELGRKFNMQALAADAIKGGLSADQMRHNVLVKLGDQAEQVMLDKTSLGLTKKEAQSFSFLRAIRAMANPADRRMHEAAAFELEASQEYAKKTGQTSKGFLIPNDVTFGEPSDELKRALLPYMKRDLNVGTASQGGYSVATDLMSGSFIELLRARLVLADAGIVQMANLQGNVAIPRQAGPATGYWVTSEGGSPTESTQAIGQLQLSPKTVGAFSDFTRQLLLQSSIDVEAFIRADFAKVLALKIDAAGITGAGAAGEPQGVKNLTGIGTQSFASSGDPTFAEVVGMEGNIDASNALAGSIAYIAHPTMVAKMKVKSVVSGQAIFVWGTDNQVNGYRGLRTTQVAATNLYLGNWSNLILAMWGGLDMTADPYTQSTSGTVRVVALQSCDFGARHVESFCLGA